MIIVYEIKEQNEETNQISLIELSDFHIKTLGSLMPLGSILLQIIFFGRISSAS